MLNSRINGICVISIFYISAMRNLLPKTDILCSILLFYLSICIDHTYILLVGVHRCDLRVILGCNVFCKAISYTSLEASDMSLATSPIFSPVPYLRWSLEACMVNIECASSLFHLYAKQLLPPSSFRETFHDVHPFCSSRLSLLQREIFSNRKSISLGVGPDEISKLSFSNFNLVSSKFTYSLKSCFSFSRYNLKSRFNFSSLSLRITM